MIRNFAMVILISGLVLGFSIGTYAADTRGRLSVKIVDSNDKPLKDVKITLQSKEAESLHYEITTDKKGKAVKIGMDPHLFYVKAEKEGYQNREGELKLRPGVWVKQKWVMLTIPEAKETAVQQALDEMTDEERAVIAAEDEINKGLEAYQKDDVETAKQHFLSAIEKAPDASHYPYLFLGQFAFNDRNVDEAITYLEKAYTHDTEKQNLQDICTMLGASFMIKEDLTNAKKYWSQVCETADNPQILYNLANIEIHNGKMTDAIAWLEKARGKFPEYTDGLQLLGDIYLQEQNYAKALEVYEQLATVMEKSSSADSEKLKMARDTITALREQLKKK
ncbi:tetratricopeptide repeat protein [bacterium]|nr:tetratricopeptide repeat protein [candidate division CSSED10-310 bacterium]